MSMRNFSDNMVAMGFSLQPFVRVCELRPCETRIHCIITGNLGLDGSATLSMILTTNIIGGTAWSLIAKLRSIVTKNSFQSVNPHYIAGENLSPRAHTIAAGILKLLIITQ